MKRDAVILKLEVGRSAAEVVTNLDIGSGTLQHRVSEAKGLKDDAFTGNGHKTPEQDKVCNFEAEVQRRNWNGNCKKGDGLFFTKELN